jgi:phage tail sheath gpL-like
MLPASAVSRVCGVNVEYRNFNAGAGGYLPQRLAVIGAGNDDVEYSDDKFESTGSADEIGKRYGYGSPLHLAARQLFPPGGGGAAFPVTIYPLIADDGSYARETVRIANTSGQAVTGASGEYTLFDGSKHWKLKLDAPLTLEPDEYKDFALAAEEKGHDPNLVTGVDVAGYVTPALPAGVTVVGISATDGTDPGAAPAQGAISCDGTAAAAGEGSVTIGGASAVFAVLKDMTAGQTLSAIRAAIQKTLEMPVMAESVIGGEIPLTAKWSGAGGNEIRIEINCDVEGLTFGVTAMAGGAVDPDVSSALNKIGQVWETFVLSCLPYNNETRLDKYQTFAEGRWSELEKKPCLVAHGCTDDFATRTALTDQRKTDYANFLIQSTGSAELPFVIAARGLVNDIMTTANSNPPTGYHGLLTGLKAGADSAQENYATRNNAVLKGASTNVKNGSVAELNDIITFYHPDGEAIPSRRYVVDLVKLANVVFNVRMIMEADEMKGAPLVSDATPTTNPKAIQPKTVRTSLINLANSLAAYAIIQEPEFTKLNMSVDISSQNPKRLDVRFPVKLSGNVEVTSTDIYFGFYLGAA